MGQLGTIVELRTVDNSREPFRRYKQKYPIVYENKTKYYCKQYGTDTLVSFNKTENPHNYYANYVLDYEEFNEKRKELLYSKKPAIFVKVTSFEEDDFEEWSPKSLDSLKGELNFKIEESENIIKRSQHEIDKLLEIVNHNICLQEQYKEKLKELGE